MLFSLWTDDAALAAAAARAGVHAIGPDLEWIGKHERQAGGDSLVSGHDMGCMPDLRRAIGDAVLFARCNGPGPWLASEIDRLLDLGVASVMLPMVRSVADARAVAKRLRGRAELRVMIEHADALPIADELASIDEVAELYVGANDLARSLGLASRFAVLASGMLDRIAAVAHRHERRFSFFGLARPDTRGLPVPAELVYAEWARLGVESCVIARSFDARVDTIAAGIAAARERIEHWRGQPAAARAQAHQQLVQACLRADRRDAARKGRVGPAGIEPATKRL